MTYGETGGFHIGDGMYFKREKNGTVYITIRETASPEAPIEKTFFMNASTWASVVASVSVFGENEMSFRAAEHLHGKCEILKEGDK